MKSSRNVGKLKDSVKWKSECNLLLHVDVFPAKTGLVGYGLTFTVANKAECALCLPSAPADNIAVCEYTEQYNPSTTGLYAHHGIMLRTQT